MPLRINSVTKLGFAFLAIVYVFPLLFPFSAAAQDSVPSNKYYKWRDLWVKYGDDVKLKKLKLKDLKIDPKQIIQVIIFEKEGLIHGYIINTSNKNVKLERVNDGLDHVSTQIQKDGQWVDFQAISYVDIHENSYFYLPLPPDNACPFSFEKPEKGGVLVSMRFHFMQGSRTYRSNIIEVLISEESYQIAGSPIIPKKSKKYLSLIKKADEAFILGIYSDAKKLYREAYELYPYDNHPKEKIEDCEWMMEEIMKDAQ